jgi:hypothetical protein
VVPEGVVEDLGLIQPGRMGRYEPVTSPTAAGLEVFSRQPGGVAGVAVVNQAYAAQLVMATLESLQLPDVVRRIFRLNAFRFHRTTLNDQEVQDVDRLMPPVLEFLLFDRAMDRTVDRVAFHDRMVGHLIGADHLTRHSRNQKGALLQRAGVEQRF